MDLPPGSFLGPYEIVHPLEPGGMSRVFRARDVRLNREVALKVLPTSSMLDDSLVKRFQLEARAAASLSHPNIVAVYDVGEADATVKTPIGPEVERVRYIVQEFVEGSSLRKLIHKGSIPLGEQIQLAIGIARGLAAAHDKGLVHRDLKPENILIDRVGTPKIADFGLVQSVFSDSTQSVHGGGGFDLTRTGFVVGTLGYMSPEQARGDTLGPRSDIFVFGLLMYEMLTGVAPFLKTNPDDAFRAVLKEDPPPIRERIPEAPPAYESIILRCLEKAPEERYASTANIASHLEKLRRSLRLDESGQPMSHSGPRRMVTAAEPTLSPLVWLCAASAVLVAFAGGFAVGRRAPVRQTAVEPAPRPEWRGEWRAELCGQGARDVEPLGGLLTPDAGEVVYTAATGDESDVYVVPARGDSQPRLLSRDDAGGRAPFVAPDGRTVLYSAARLDVPGGIWEVPLDGSSEPKQLIEEGEEPAISRNGDQICYVRRSPEGSELWVCRRDGLLRRHLLAGPGAEWRYPVFSHAGVALFVFEIRKEGQPYPGSARLLRVSLTDPKPAPYFEASPLDARGRPTPLAGGAVLLRSFADRSAFYLEPKARALHRLPFGAGLSSLSATREWRAVLTRTDGGPLILWRRL